jgi:hypothetical protein
VTVRWLDHSKVFLAAVRPAQEAALVAEANVYRNAVIRWIRDWHGYLTTLGNIGDFYRDGGIQFISVGAIENDMGSPSIRVGSSWPVHRYWELGHHNIFTRHFERDERWKPAYDDARANMVETYMRKFAATIRAMGFNVKGIGGAAFGDAGEATA